MAGRYQVGSKAARTVDGIVFDSAAEARRYSELRLLERAGSVTDIERQPEFELVPGFRHPDHGAIRAIKYRADFRYKLHGREVVEDVKGHATEVYRIKKKLLLWKYPELDFREVR
ncbi:MAG: DUF1064 domain-containing protein [Alkalispirochaeta sp.]